MNDDTELFHNISISCPICHASVLASIHVSLHTDNVLLQAYCERCDDTFQKITTLEEEREIIRERGKATIPTLTATCDLRKVEVFVPVQ